MTTYTLTGYELYHYSSAIDGHHCWSITDNQGNLTPIPSVSSIAVGDKIVLDSPTVRSNSVAYLTGDPGTLGVSVSTQSGSYDVALRIEGDNYVAFTSDYLNECSFTILSVEPGEMGDVTLQLSQDRGEQPGDESSAEGPIKVLASNAVPFIKGKVEEEISENIGKAKELTSADYNWPTTGTKTSVNLSLLPVGFYYRESNSVAESTGLSGDYLTFVVGQKGTHEQLVIALGKDNDPNGSPTLSRRYYDNQFQESRIVTPEIVDNLTSTKTGASLSAKQGKVLNERIGDLATLKTTAKTSTVAAINELADTVDDIEPQSGSGAPTSSTEGTIGQTYVDTSTGDIYYLSEIIEESGEPDNYVWKKIGDEAEEHNDYGKIEYYTDVTKVYNIMSDNATASMTSESTYEQFLQDNGIDPVMVMFDYRETETQGEYVWTTFSEQTGEEIEIAPADMLSTTGITVTIDDPSMPWASLHIDLQRTVNTSGPTAFLQLTSQADYEHLAGTDTTTDPDFGPFGDQEITLYGKQIKTYIFPNWWVGYTPDKFLQSASNLVAIHSDYKLKMYSDDELQEVIPVDTIGHSFLSYCSSFNSRLNFSKKDYVPASYEEKKVFHIGNAFLNSCSALASPVCVWASNSAIGADFDVTVGSDFMNGCSHYTSQYHGNNFVYDLYQYILRHAKEIPNNFMSGCQAVTMIYGFSSTNVVATKIGGGFFRGTGLTSAYLYATNLTSLGGAFASCSSLTSITIPNSPQLQYIGTIGDGSSALTSVTFTKPLLKVTEVGGFCNNASNLTTITIAGNAGVFLPNVAIIGDYFLNKLPLYNSPIDIVNVKSIGGYFLQNDTTFNQSIAFNKLYSVGTYFMNNCDAFTSTVNIGGSLANVFAQSNYTFGTSSSSAALYTTGATIVGEDVNAFLTRFADRTSSPYRKLISGGTGEEIITNAGAPTTATVGSVGQLLEDTTNGKLYICTAVSGSTYTWEEVGGGSIKTLGSSDYNYPTSGTADGIALWLLDTGDYLIEAGTNVYYTTTSQSQLMSSGLFEVTSSYDVVGVRTMNPYGNESLLSIAPDGSSLIKNAQVIDSTSLQQSTGTLTTYAMSQNAVTSMVFADPSTKQKIQVGANATASGERAIAIGNYAQATARGSIALGDYSISTVTGVMHIGQRNSNGYNSSNYRLLTGLYDPQSAHDAATKGYVDTSITSAIGQITGFSYQVVSTLPVSGEKGVIYLVPTEESGDPQNIYEEYIWMIDEEDSGDTGRFELIGTTEIDLSDYVTNSQLNTTLADYVTSSSLSTTLSNYATTASLSQAIINGGTTAPTTATVGAVGTLYSYVDITGATPTPHMLVCTVADTVTPSYTWVDMTPNFTTNEWNALWA